MANILVIDDEELICWFLQKELNKDGHNVLIATTGEKGIEAFRENYVQYVITDLKLPDISGFEVIKKIKKLKPEVKVIATTAWKWEEVEKKDFRNSVDGFFEKPLDLTHLKEILK